MDFTVKNTALDKGHTGALIVAVLAGGVLSPSAAALDQASNGAVKALVKLGDVTGKCGNVVVQRHLGGFDRVVLVGVGKDTSDKAWREAATAGLRALRGTETVDATFALTEVAVAGRDLAWKAEQAATLAIDAQYNFAERFAGIHIKKHDPSKRLTKLAIVADKSDSKVALAALAQGAAIGEGMNLTKDLGNLPGNIATPRYLADEAKKLGKAFGLKVTVLDEKDLAKLGMNVFLSVSKGSAEPPRLITIEYTGIKGNAKKKAPAPLALVGKGITFDTGGISLKPGAEMDEMKYDMCGAASVFGTLKAIATLKLPVNVVGVIAAAENMPSDRATKPGDIFTSLSGQTVEVLNTDAEGRLVLCDALTYTEQTFKPSKCVDIATLTGAMVIALGSHTAGLFANNDALAQEIMAAGNACYDRAWQLPLFAEYDEMLKSNFADIPNITGSRAAGAITAACYLARFTKNMVWAHLDIAGIANKSGAEKGATGRPVPLLTHWVASHA